ncbi:hypothetical protein EYC84_005689 [Monilinia fructicola]|uniref:Uncharacterized protein n=1 Tax=Monilinia fructicola TaxID=38448 RepID=A0A5M9K5U4_MONFR|nr:hypothetical protein EYC84_005689 [Monilinia fructicola]
MITGPYGLVILANNETDVQKVATFLPRIKRTGRTAQSRTNARWHAYGNNMDKNIKVPGTFSSPLDILPKSRHRTLNPLLYPENNPANYKSDCCTSGDHRPNERRDVHASGDGKTTDSLRGTDGLV